MIAVKEGVTLVGVQPVMYFAALVFWQVFGECTITSGTDPAPGRVANSLHRLGYAIDVRLPQRSEFVVNGPERLASQLGEHFDVVWTDTHVHIEYDPR